LKKYYQIDPEDSWILEAAKRNLPIFVPGAEDSTLGNMYAAHCLMGDIKNPLTLKSGIEYMMELANWYIETSKKHSIGFFQIGGGISGDFSYMRGSNDSSRYEKENVPLWVILSDF